jgi:EmrB/QacA subfamily drug resistance transporter
MTEAAVDAPPPMTTVQKVTLAATGLGLFMIFLDALIVNVALPDIQAEFGVGEEGLQWVVTAYSLGMAVFIMSGATVADLHGRKKVFLAGVTVFTLASLACGLAPNLAFLNVSRGIQGVAAAVANVTSLALVSAAFPDPKAKAKAIGLWTAIASVAIAVGPTLGGILTAGVGWRAIFLVNLPVGIVAVTLTVRYVTESRDPSGRGLDLPGQVLFAVTVGAFAFAVIEGPQSGWSSPLILGLLAVAVVGFVTFVVVERRVDDPMMDLTLFHDRTYSVAIGTIFVQFFAVYGMLLVVTQYLQNIKDFSPVVAGLLLLPFSLGIVVFSPIAGRTVARIGARRPVLLGVSSLLVGLTLIGVGVATTVVLVTIGLFFIGFAGAFCLTPITTLAMTSVPPERAGMASGIMSAQRAIGSTVGFAVLGSILAAWLAATLPADLTTAIPDPVARQDVADQIVEEANPRAYTAEIGPGKPLSSATPATEEAITDAADADFVQGIQIGLAVAGVLSLIALVACVRWLPRHGEGLAQAEREASDLEAEETQRLDGG